MWDEHSSTVSVLYTRDTLSPVSYPGFILRDKGLPP